MSEESGSQERVARLALSQLFEPGDARIGGLVAEYGAVRLRHLLAAELDLADERTESAARLAVLDPERDLAAGERLGYRWIIPGDAEWPPALSDLDHADPVVDVGGAPLGVWARGPLRLDTLPVCVALVGSRSSTTYGEQVAHAVAAEVGAAGLAIVSGAAIGIDQAGHRGALVAGGPTVAVLACGVDRVYPPRHKPLLDHLAEHGVIVSEQSPGRAPLRSRFLSRNRIIAALAAGTVVVEAASRSGALNTATWASRLNRPLMGVPGPVSSASSEGVHRLIRTGAATLVTSGAEVLEMVGRSGEHLAPEPRAPDRPRDRLDRCSRRVLEAVPVRSAAPSEAIARTAGLGLVDVHRALTSLGRAGLVSRAGSGWRLTGADRAAPAEPVPVPVLEC